MKSNQTSKIPRRVSNRKKTLASEVLIPEEVAPNQLKKITMDNTKRNSLYTSVDIKIEPVQVDRPRPDSPPRNWSRRGELTDHEDDDLEQIRLRWSKKLIFLDDLEPKAPLSPAIKIPVKPILKRKTHETSSFLIPDIKEEIVVKKLMYPEDYFQNPDMYTVEDIMADLDVIPKSKKKKKHTQAGNVKGTPKRILNNTRRKV